jgi:hypothetical protein
MMATGFLLLLLLYFTPQELHKVVIGLSVLVVTTVLSGGGIGTFNTMLGNNQLAMVPGVRFNLVLAQFCTTVVTALFFSLIISSATGGGSILAIAQIFLWFFDTLTIFTLGYGYILRKPSRLIISMILAILFLVPIEHNFEIIRSIINSDMAMILVSLTVVSIVFWIAQYYWTLHVRKAVNGMSARSIENPFWLARLDDWLQNKLTRNLAIDPSQSLMRDKPWSREQLCPELAIVSWAAVVVYFVYRLDRLWLGEERRLLFFLAHSFDCHFSDYFQRMSVAITLLMAETSGQPKAALGLLESLTGQRVANCLEYHADLCGHRTDIFNPFST